MNHVPLSVQLYTIRDQVGKDFSGAMTELARIGYVGVELAGYGNLASAQEAKKALDDAGLRVTGSHTRIETLEADMNKVLDEQAILGNSVVIISYMPEDRRQNASGWQKVAESLNRLGSLCRRQGFELGYHNHSFEFQDFEGRSGMDILWDNTDPLVLKSELDVYWVAHGGKDPVAYMKQLGSRIVALHLKDMADGPERRFAEVGAGILDFKGILETAQKLGVAHYIVEQDSTYDVPPMDALKTSFANLKKLGAV